MQTLNSFGLGYRLVGTTSFKDRVLDGAESLYGFRYVVRVGVSLAAMHSGSHALVAPPPTYIHTSGGP